MNKMPLLFAGHGSPMNVLTNSPFNDSFHAIAQTLPRPKAVLMISAHWYDEGIQIMANPNPPMIYDFYGFPDELYQVNYPAQGAPELARQVQVLLAEEGATLNATRGFDHGAWAVLKFLYPNADVPVLQLSLDRNKTAVANFQLAKKLAILREEGVLIMGSGNIVHNLRVMSREHINTIGAGYDWAFAFNDAIKQAIIAQDTDILVNYLQLGDAANLSVPTPEHYLPILYLLALRDPSETVQFFNDELVGGSLSMTSFVIGK